MFDDLKDRAVVVTGGVTGIGGAASLAFAAAGARVLAQYLGGIGEADKMEAKGIATLQLDLTNPGAPAALMTEARRRLGRIDEIGRAHV